MGKHAGHQLGQVDTLKLAEVLIQSKKKIPTRGDFSGGEHFVHTVLARGLLGVGMASLLVKPISIHPIPVTTCTKWPLSNQRLMFFRVSDIVPSFVPTECGVWGRGYVVFAKSP